MHVTKCKQRVRIGKRAAVNVGKWDFLFYELIFFIFQCRGCEATVKGRETLIDIYLFLGSLNKVRDGETDGGSSYPLFTLRSKKAVTDDVSKIKLMLLSLLALG